MVDLGAGLGRHTQHMLERGLRVTAVTPELAETWRKTAEAVYPQIRGNIIPADIYDQVMSLIKEYEATHPAPGK